MGEVGRFVGFEVAYIWNLGISILVHPQVSCNRFLVDHPLVGAGSHNLTIESQ